MRKVSFEFFNNFKKIKNILQFSSHDTSTIEGKSNERYRRILLTGGSTAVVKLFSAAINLITVPLTINYLGSERYGLWMTISSIIAIMAFADLGLGNGLLNAVSKANARSNKKEAQVAVSSTFFILLGISSLLFIIFISVYSFIPWEYIFNVKSKIAISESGPTILVLVIMLLINIPLGVIQRIQNGYQEGYRYQTWLAFGSLISFFGLLTCIFFETGLPSLVFAFSGGQLFATVLNGIHLFYKKRPYIKPRLRHFQLSVGKILIKKGLVFFFLVVFTLIANASDNIIIAQTLGPDSVSAFEIVKKLFLFSMLTNFIIEPLWPAFGEAIESGDMVWAKKTFNKVLLLSIGAGLIITLPLLLFGKQIIEIWVGEEFIPPWSLLLGFYVYIILLNYTGVMSVLINSSDLVGKQLLPIGLSAVISIILKVFLSLYFGISGIIWATVIAWSVAFVIPAYYLSKAVLHKKIIINNRYLDN